MTLSGNSFMTSSLLNFIELQARCYRGGQGGLGHPNFRQIWGKKYTYVVSKQAVWRKKAFFGSPKIPFYGPETVI